MKTAKVTQVHNTKEWAGKHGVTIYCDLTLDNGDEINIGKKKAPAVGDSIDYELTGGDDGQQRFKKAKAVQPQQQNAPAPGKTYTDNSDSILYQVCLKEAVNLTIATSKETFVTASPETICTLAYDLAAESKKRIKQLKNVG